MTRVSVTTTLAAVAILVAAPGSVFAQPANDSALTPTVIGSLPFEDRLDTTTATTDAQQWRRHREEAEQVADPLRRLRIAWPLTSTACDRS